MGGLFGGGGDASDSAREAAEIQAEAQREALDYLKQTEQIPEHLRQASMAKLAGIYGLDIDPAMLSYGAPSMYQQGTYQQSAYQPAETTPEIEQLQRLRGSGYGNMGNVLNYAIDRYISEQSGGAGMQATQQAQPAGYYQTGSQQDFIDEVLATPLYGALMSGQQAGEDAILRSAAQTGGLRSGNVQEALYDYNTQLQNQALLQAYQQQLSGLTGLAGMPSKASDISGQIAGIGQTQAAGITAAAQAEQAGQQQVWNNILGIASLPLGGGSTIGGSLISGIGDFFFSDRRLKKNIKIVGEINGWPWYKWTWNIVAEKMGIKGESQGIMADEVYAKKPEAVVVKDLFLMVNYGSLGVFENGRA